MMKFHTLTTTGLAAVLLWPTLVQDPDVRTLQRALSGTDRALTALEEVRLRIEQDPITGIEMILAATEPPLLDERGRDERLQTLRDEVNRLRMQLDVLEVPPSLLPPLAGPSGSSTEPQRPTVPVTGLNDEVRRALQRLDGPAPPRTAPPAASGAAPPEADGYSADRLGQARASYRAGKYEDALRLLSDVGDDPVALYWKARSLEKLGRVDEAIPLLERVATLAPDSLEGKRAKTDAEFLTWKREFEKKMPKGSGGKPAGKGSDR